MAERSLKAAVLLPIILYGRMDHNAATPLLDSLGTPAAQREIHVLASTMAASLTIMRVRWRGAADGNHHHASAINEDSRLA